MSQASPTPLEALRGFDVLVVDDSPENVRVVVGLLQGAGYKARGVPNGPLALQAVAMQRPDLILLDVRLPGMDGFQVCDELRRRPEWRDIPIIFLSALADEADKLRAFEAGGVDYITKPFRVAEVLARVGTHVELARCRASLVQTSRLLDHRAALLRGQAGEVPGGQAKVGTGPEPCCTQGETAAPPLAAEHGADVLVVDDEPDCLRLMIGVLQEAGFKVRGAISGELALQAVARKRPDLVLLDVLMPGLDGYGLCSALREDPACQGTPIIFLTQLTGPEDMMRAFRVGGVDYVTKPVRSAELVARVDTHLRLRRVRQDLETMVAVRAAQLRESEQRYRRIFESMEEGYLLADMAGRVLTVNPATVRLLGYGRPEDLEGRSLADHVLVDPADGERLEAVLMQDGSGTGFVTRFRRRDGAPIEVDCNLHLLRDGSGAPTGIEGTFRDITERLRREQRSRHAQRMESIGTLAGGVAHDINNILAPMLMATEILRDRLPDAHDRELLEMIESGARRGAGIVRQLLAFSRHGDGGRASVQPRHVIKEMLAIMRETFPRNIDVRARYPSDLRTVPVDGTQLHQVLMNLCVNARDAMPEGGTLTVSAQDVELDEAAVRDHAPAGPGSYVILAVEDTGHGMPPEVIERIFDPFFTTKHDGRGTGLGLSTAGGIVRAHGGFVTVTSEPGRGSTFRVHLPACPDPEDVAPEPGDATERRAVGNQELVLVVDDEEPICAMVSRSLPRQGYRVVTAPDGAAALRAFQESRGEVGVVVTDLMMPGMDGLALVRALRAIDPGVRIVASSGLAEIDRREELAALGVSTVLEKPFTSASLCRAIEGALATAPDT